MLFHCMSLFSRLAWLRLELPASTDKIISELETLLLNPAAEAAETVDAAPCRKRSRADAELPADGQPRVARRKVASALRATGAFSVFGASWSNS